MKNIIRIYLYILPLFSLAGIVLGIFRTAFEENYVQYILLLGALFDLVIIVSGWRRLFSRMLAVVFFLLMLSFIIGLLNNEISRRLVTDFTVPFFFFAKISLFSLYWQTNDIKKFISFYTKTAFWGSLILLPVVYFIFSEAGVTRLAIFPPMELPFSYYMQGGGKYFLISLILILLYGKRAQLGGAILTFMMFVVFFKRNQLGRYFLIAILTFTSLVYIFENYSDNIAISRLKHTYDSIFNSANQLEGLESVSAGRDVEIETLLNEMQPIDFIIGKGMGFTYNQIVNDEVMVTANAHFSPLALISKYGLGFTLFLYIFLLDYLRKFNHKLGTREYITMYGVLLFVFIESFFAYALFVTPILPVALGYLMQKNRSSSAKKIVNFRTANIKSPKI